MAYDLEEQEQLDELKAWWKVYGKLVSNAVLGLLLVYAAYQGWQYYHGKQAVEASTEFQALQVADEKDVKTIQSKAAVIMDKYSSTPYCRWQHPACSTHPQRLPRKHSLPRQ